MMRVISKDPTARAMTPFAAAWNFIEAKLAAEPKKTALNLKPFKRPTPKDRSLTEKAQKRFNRRLHSKMAKLAKLAKLNKMAVA